MSLSARTPARGATLASQIGIDPRILGMGAALIVIALGFHAASDGLFLTPRNLYNLAVQTSVVGVMACGMVLVISAGQIDLSVGSLLGLCGMSIAFLQAEWLPEAAWSWPLSVVAGVALGVVLGACQGWWVVYRGVPAFIVTLAGLLAFRGLAYLVSDGRTIAPLAEGFELLGGGRGGSIGVGASWVLGALAVALVLAFTLRARNARSAHGFEQRSPAAEALRTGLLAITILGFVAVTCAYTHPKTGLGRGIPVPVLIWAITAGILSIVFHATRFGRYLLAIGGNRDAAALAGIDVRRATLAAFAWMGGLAALGGTLTAARLAAGTSSMGTLTELSVIAAAVIGGTSLSGGRGSIGGAILGALMMQSLENGMLLLGASSAVRQISIGAVLLLAVWIDGASRRMRAQR